MNNTPSNDEPQLRPASVMISEAIKDAERWAYVRDHMAFQVFHNTRTGERVWGFRDRQLLEGETFADAIDNEIIAQQGA